MPKIAYSDKKLGQAKLDTIAAANDIIAEYDRQGLRITLRQLYYQFVARALLTNTERSYKNLGNAISDGRLAGLINWYAIEDRTRNLAGNSHWSHPGEIVEAAAKGFRVDKWKRSPRRVEVWVEKEALAGVVARPCRDLDVDYFSCRGYVSQSEMWSAGQRLKRYIEDGQEVTVLYLGDHDPSGIDMTRDVDDRTTMFSWAAWNELTIKRIALNMPQVDELSPPPNPAKLSDSRAGDYIARFGNESWELDALPPEYLDRLIRDEINALVDWESWEQAVAYEDDCKAKLAEFAEQWND